MAKRYEFRQDKSGAGLLSKLYLTQKQRRALVKWCLYALLLLALSVLQDVIFSRMRIFGATTDLVPCGIFLICIFEGIHTGSVFSLVAAIVFYFSGMAPGVYAMVLAVFCAVFFCIFREAYLQKGFGAAVICTVAAMIVYELAVFSIGLFLGLTYWQRVFGFLFTAAISSLAAPVLYPIVSAIGTLGGDTWKE